MAKRALIVDDNERNRKLLRVILCKAGYETVEAEDGVRALALARETRPDIVLMDYRMPNMNGIEATRAIKADGATGGIPVFIVTSSAMEGDRDRIIRESGCDELYTKPIDYRQIVDAVARKLGG
jgi:two-component system, cell cycle response regulator DivK